MKKSIFLKINKTRMMLIIFFLFPVFTISAVSFSRTEKLINDLSTTIRESRITISRLNSLKRTISKTIRAINTAKKVSRTISKINNGLKKIQITMTALKAIPNIRTAISNMKKAVDKIRHQINKIDVKAKNFIRKLNTVKRKLITLRKMTNQAISIVKKTKRIAISMKKRILKVKGCINSLEQGEKKNNLAKKIERFSVGSDPSVRKINRVLITINRASIKVKTALKKIMRVCFAFRKIKPGLNIVWKRMRLITRMLGKINWALKKRLKIPYKFKVKVKIPFKIKVKFKKWYNPFKWKWSFKWKKKYKWGFKWKTKYYRFSVYKILKGINTKIKWINKKFLGWAKRLLRPLLRKLQIRFPKIKGMNYLYVKLRISERFIRKFNLAYRDFMRNFRNLRISFKRYRLKLSKFNMKCNR